MNDEYTIIEYFFSFFFLQNGSNQTNLIRVFGKYIQCNIKSITDLDYFNKIFKMRLIHSIVVSVCNSLFFFC